MTEEITEKHRYTSDQKIKWFGYGEWVEEPDEIFFEHIGISCKILRMTGLSEVLGDSIGQVETVCGGHLCGYCKIPEEVLPGLDVNETHFEVHGGITYGRIEEDNCLWTGFDCAHAHDISPGMEVYMASLFAFPIKIPLCERSYKNIQYVMRECKSLAEQIARTFEKKLIETIEANDNSFYRYTSARFITGLMHESKGRLYPRAFNRKNNEGMQKK